MFPNDFPYIQPCREKEFLWITFLNPEFSTLFFSRSIYMLNLAEKMGTWELQSSSERMCSSARGIFWPVSSAIVQMLSPPLNGRRFRYP